MPELPEVETIRIGLQKHLVGHTIEKVDIRFNQQFTGDPAAIIGAKIIAVRRFGKGLIIDLNNNLSIAVHVKMTGQLVYKKASRVPKASQMPRAMKISELNIDNLPDKYTSIIFHLDNQSLLFFRDIRKFGWIKVVPTKKISDLPFFKSLGAEPLKDLTFDKYSNILKSVRTSIKTLLMDQSKIAGIGNIYANEALFLSGIHPARPAQSLSEKEVRSLFDAIEKVLKKGIESGGASEVNFVNAIGEKGTYQKHFLIYKKTGKPCPNCGTIIKKMKIGGRGTFYCPGCQE